jgi:hypothetical protein
LEVVFGSAVLRGEGGGAVLGGEGGVAVPCLEEAWPPEIRALDPPGSTATVDPHKPPPPVRAAPLDALLGLRPALVARVGPAAHRRERERERERERGARHQLACERKRRSMWCAVVGEREESGAVGE